MQSDYEALMGNDPSTFDGEGLPVDNISWLEAVQYANVRSNAAGLTPVYMIGDGEVVWDRSLPLAHRSRVGVCLPCRNRDTI